MTQEIHGTVADGFEAVREEFAAVVAGQRPDYEGQLTAYVHGRRVVDLWTGPDTHADTLYGVFSSTKGAAHLVVALLVQDGVLQLDREVAHYWPEFAAEGRFQATGEGWYPFLGAGAFGHGGAGGTQAFADPRSGLAYGYTRRRVAFPGGAAPENARLVRAVHSAAVRR